MQIWLQMKHWVNQLTTRNYGKIQHVRLRFQVKPPFRFAASTNQQWLLPHFRITNQCMITVAIPNMIIMYPLCIFILVIHDQYWILHKPVFKQLCWYRLQLQHLGGKRECRALIRWFAWIATVMWFTMTSLAKADSYSRHCRRSQANSDWKRWRGSAWMFNSRFSFLWSSRWDKQLSRPR